MPFMTSFECTTEPYRKRLFQTRETFTTFKHCTARVFYGVAWRPVGYVDGEYIDRLEVTNHFLTPGQRFIGIQHSEVRTWLSGGESLSNC